MQFTIIIPAYNVEKYVVQCLDSVFRQDYPKDAYEVIVINDCSTDTTLNILKQFRKQLIEQYPNANLIILNNETNIRQGGARNRGLRIATGEYVMFVDSDDCWLANNVLSVYHDYMSKHEVDFVDAWEYKDIKSGFTIDTVYKRSYTYSAPVSSNERLIVSKNLCSVWLSCYKRNYIIEKKLWFAEKVCFEDTDWRIQCVSQANKIGIIDFVYYGYRCNPMSTTNVGNKKLLKDSFEALNRLYEWVYGIDIQRTNIENIIYRIKRNIIDNIKYGRKFELKDSCSVFCSIKKMPIATISFDRKIDNLLFWTMKNIPLVLMLPLRAKYLMGQWWLYFKQITEHKATCGN